MPPFAVVIFSRRIFTLYYITKNVKMQYLIWYFNKKVKKRLIYKGKLKIKNTASIKIIDNENKKVV